MINEDKAFDEMVSSMNELTYIEDEDDFIISNDIEADWQIDKIAIVTADLKRKEMVANAKIEQIQQWLNKERESAEKEIHYREFLLLEYIKSLPDSAVQKTKTQKIYKLPSGTLRLKEQQPEYKRDDEKLLQWVKANKPRFVKTKEYVDWAGLKEVVAAEGSRVVDIQTGEIIDGVEVIERGPKFEVEAQ
jgi:phage host-nuclease inhibitor protein Gam